MIEVRCSALPRVCLCPAAAAPPQVLFEDEGPEARLGTAVHAVLAAWIKAGGPDPAAMKDQARLAGDGVDPDELALLCGWGWSAWTGGLRQWFPSPTFEGALHLEGGGVRLTGHPDVLAYAWPAGPEYPCEARVLDWKTGRADPDPWDQLRGYALLAVLEAPAVDQARCCVARLRDGTADWRTWTRGELLAWWHGLTPRLTALVVPYNPSAAACQYCPRAHECPARQALMREALAIIALPGSAAGPAQLYDSLRLAEGYAEHARELLRGETAVAGGRLDLGDGRELVLAEQRRRRLDYLLALPVLSDCLSGAEIACLVELPVGALEKAVAGKAPRGQKQQAKQIVLARLEEAGAVSVQTSSRLECRRAAPSPQT